jgi:hypothetical protein
MAMSETRVVNIGGLSALPGDHICAFYRGRAERHQLMVSFLREGVRAGDKCICISSAGERAHLGAAVTKDAPEANASQLQMEDFDSTYLRSGSFTGQNMLAFWGQWASEVFERDRWPFARGVTDMSWLDGLVGSPVVDDLLDYEVQATRFARSYPQVALCLYDLELFGGNLIFPVMKVHPKVLFSGILLENPYYLDPDEVPIGA